MLGWVFFIFSIKGRPCSNSPREAACIQIGFSGKGRVVFIFSSQLSRPRTHALAFGFQKDASRMDRW